MRLLSNQMKLLNWSPSPPSPLSPLSSWPFTSAPCSPHLSCSHLRLVLAKWQQQQSVLTSMEQRVHQIEAEGEVLSKEVDLLKTIVEEAAVRLTYYAPMFRQLPGVRIM